MCSGLDLAVRSYMEREAQGMFGAGAVVFDFGPLAREAESTIHRATVRTSDGVRHVALRVFNARSGTNLDDKALHEWTFMSALQGQAPVPRVYGVTLSSESGLGVPVIVMDRILGHTLSHLYWSQQGQEARAGVVRTFTDCLVRLHNVDAAGLEGIPVNFDMADPYAYTRAWRTELAAAIDTIPIPDLRPIAAWLANTPETPCPAYSVLHGDYHLKNVMMSEQGEPAILDWPASRVGDALDDLAWMYVIHVEHPAICGTTLDLYRTLSGKGLDGFDACLVKAALVRIYNELSALREEPMANATGNDSDPKARRLGRQLQLRGAYGLVRRYTGLDAPSILDAIDAMA